MSQAEQSLPRKSALSLAGIAAALSDLQDAIRGLPAVDHKDVEIVAGDLPLYVYSKIRDAQGLYVAGVWNLDTSTSAAYCTGVSWAKGASVGEYAVAGLNGLTVGTRYRVRLKIEGKR